MSISKPPRSLYSFWEAKTSIQNKQKSLLKTKKLIFYTTSKCFNMTHMIWPHLFYKLYTAPLLLTLLPRTLGLFLSENISSLFIPQGVYTLLFPAWNEICSVSFVWLSPFHHSGNQWSERPTLTTLTLLSPSPRHMCSSLFYFHPSIYHSLKFSYVYTCLWRLVF